MTRENKLALIIGFGLVLVVGILVSDHLSARQETADSVAEQREADPLDRIAAADSLTPVEVPSHRVTSDARRPIRLEPTAPAVNSTHMGDDAVHFPSSEPDIALTATDDRTGRDDVIPQTPFLEEIRNVDLQRPATSDDAAARDAVEPLSFVWYTIQPKESLSKICEKIYGDMNLWPRLAAFNEDRIPDPNRVRDGVTIRVPTREALVGGARVAEPSGAAPAGPARESPPPAQDQRNAEAGEFTTYIIQAGDTLGEISSRFLGTSRRYREIHELNRDVIPDPDNIVSGRTIRIPRR
jgi:nucleoid-associated protein YgaU